MSCKIVIIGGGSYHWTSHLATDLFLRKRLAGGELVLVDINRKAAQLLEAYCRLAAEQVGTGWKVSVASLDKALDGADVVCASISTGGLAAMHHDYTIPEKYGIYHTVGDTAGPGGISRVLRNVPVFVGFARAMEKHCPEAWMVHVTNPLSQLTRAVCKASSIRAVGLCHNYVGTTSFLAEYYGVKESDVDAVSTGINHYSWLTDITIKGKPIDTSRLNRRDYLRWEAERAGKAIETGTIDDKINEALGGAELDYYLSMELFELLGYMAVGGAPHVVENLPWYTSSPEILASRRVRRKGVMPMRQEMADKRRQEIADIVEGKTKLGKPKASRETFSAITDALVTGVPCREIVAYPNVGQIPNLPADVVVETWASISASGVSPCCAGEMPQPLRGMMMANIEEQELSVEAALSGDRSKVIQAMFVSPMVANADTIEPMTDELLAANADLLPQFKK